MIQDQHRSNGQIQESVCDGQLRIVTVNEPLNNICNFIMNIFYFKITFYIVFITNNLSTRRGVSCICQRPFHGGPPSLRCGSQTAWLSWAGLLIGRGPAALPRVSGGVSPRRPEEATGPPSPTRAGNSSSSPRPHPSRGICRCQSYFCQILFSNFSRYNQKIGKKGVICPTLAGSTKLPGAW